MMVIHKFRLAVSDVDQEVAMPAGAKILDVQSQDGWLTMWAMVDIDRPNVIRLFRVYGTGHSIERFKNLGYLATVQQGPFVWHVFEVNQMNVREVPK